ncbi:AAA family ATPase [Actibacterium pelagium]|uniref:Chaperone n=1 Tax=Actibacterium pelagium TaxID=2029103 RepID=A0A917AE10_9RHOB|nr:AAA family ATPase [Actibacterium pelagium]GGE46656.1 chaperone [Actibacterium pelagium]
MDSRKPRTDRQHLPTQPKPGAAAPVLKGHGAVGSGTYDPPVWIEECGSALAYAEHLVIWGNTRDLYPVETEAGLGFAELTDTLWHILQRHQTKALFQYDSLRQEVRLARFKGSQDEHEQLQRAIPATAKSLEDLAAAQRAITGFAEFRVALMIDHASQLHGTAEKPLSDFFVAIDRPTHGHDQTAPDNPTLWICDHPATLPDWFVVGNASIREIHVEPPNLEDRFLFAETLFPEASKATGAEPEQQKYLQQFALECEGSTLQAMGAMSAIARVENLGAEKLQQAIRIYRTGQRRDPWASSLLKERVSNARSLIEARIKGQPNAVEKTVDVLTRSVMGMSALQSSSRSSRPRGTLFFVGPTGVGKTEMAKAVTELLFADDTALHRFDMSEFMDERAIARLIGAPAGQNGHERGGELTNALQSKPFSVFLFDEIEKAHPRVLDLFLQILDEGRLTDTRGVTGYFSEALLIFTSNIGLSTGSRVENAGMNVLPSDSHEVLEQKFTRAVQDHFRIDLKRPELINRIGQNVVAFGFLSPNTIRLIFEGSVKRVLKAIEQEHGITVTLSPLAKNKLREACTHDPMEGGRGIANRVESHLVNPLARKLFDLEDTKDVEIVDIIQEQNRIWLIMEGEDPEAVMAAAQPTPTSVQPHRIRAEGLGFGKKPRKLRRP